MRPMRLLSPDFSDGEIAFQDIVQICDDLLRHHPYDSRPSLGDLVAVDRWARQEAICSDPVRLIEIVFFLGLVIFVHELGHFLVARWCGVSRRTVFDRLWPGSPQFQARRHRVRHLRDSAGRLCQNARAKRTPSVEEESSDPRSYQNKSVPQRMAIISAGVVMNIIFGFICFAFAYSVGVPSMKAIVGSTVPGKPAWKAGLEAGDRIVEVNGHKHPSYERLQFQVRFTRPEAESVHIVVDRNGKQHEFDISPEKGRLPVIGISPSESLNLVDVAWAYPTERDSVAAAAKNPGFEIGDRVTAVDGQPVKTYQEYDRYLFEHRRDPITVQVERKAAEG